MIREQREQHKQEVAFNATPFMLCGIPLRPLPKDRLVHRRRNGKFFLHIVGHPDFGLPALRPGPPYPHLGSHPRPPPEKPHRAFTSAARMLEFFRFPKDGRYYRRLVQGFQRIFASAIFFGTEEQPAGRTLIDWARFHFFDRIHLRFTEHPKGCPPSPGDHSNTITLSEAFYIEIDQHRVPMEREIVIALANSPGVLDFYVWIAWKSWVLKSAEIRVPLFSHGGLKEQLGLPNPC